MSGRRPPPALAMVWAWLFNMNVPSHPRNGYVTPARRARHAIRWANALGKAPKIGGLQEASWPDLAQWAARPRWRVVRATRNAQIGSRKIGNAIVFSWLHFRCLDRDQINVVIHPEFPGGLHLAVALLAHRKTRARILAVSLHNLSIAVPDSERKRRIVIAAVVAYIDASIRAGIPVAILGDFNENDTFLIAELRTAGLTVAVRNGVCFAFVHDLKVVDTKVGHKGITHDPQISDHAAIAAKVELRATGPRLSRIPGRPGKRRRRTNLHARLYRQETP